jgi:hypothetical protein
VLVSQDVDGYLKPTLQKLRDPVVVVVLILLKLLLLKRFANDLRDGLLTIKR